MTPLERLLAELARARSWPLPREIKILRWLAVWRALRESDEGVIRTLMKWPKDRPLIIDNLPEKIAGAFGDLEFGDAPTITPADPADQERADDLFGSWAPELPAAEETKVSEGEVWWRLSTSPDLPHPVLSWHSRSEVVPLLHGRNVLACAFVTRLPSTGQVVWRHIELHEPGRVVNTLWRGRGNALGQRVDLSRHVETADLAEEWQTGVPMMIAGRIVHRWGRRPDVGVSIYNGVWTRFLGINEATTVGRENMRLTAKKRVIVPPSAIRPRQVGADGVALEAGADRGDGSFEVNRGVARPTFDAGEDVLVHDPLDAEEGAGDRAPYKVLEYSFDAEGLISWLRFEIETACQRCDLVPQFIGSGDFGVGASGTALRVRLLPTENAADGSGRPWDGELPTITLAGQLLEVQPQPFGDIGRGEWTNPGGRPTIVRADPLPQDENEIATRHSTLKTSELISIETSLRERYPGRDDDWYLAERDRIVADSTATMPGSSFGSTGDAGDGGDGDPPATGG